MCHSHNCLIIQSFENAASRMSVSTVSQRSLLRLTASAPKGPNEPAKLTTSSPPKYAGSVHSEDSNLKRLLGRTSSLSPEFAALPPHPPLRPRLHKASLPRLPFYERSGVAATLRHLVPKKLPLREVSMWSVTGVG